VASSTRSWAWYFDPTTGALFLQWLDLSAPWGPVCASHHDFIPMKRTRAGERWDFTASTQLHPLLEAANAACPLVVAPPFSTPSSNAKRIQFVFNDANLQTSRNTARTCALLQHGGSIGRQAFQSPAAGTSLVADLQRIHITACCRAIHPALHTVVTGMKAADPSIKFGALEHTEGNSATGSRNIFPGSSLRRRMAA